MLFCACVFVCRGVCESQGEYASVNACIYIYILNGECLSHEVLGGDAARCVLCGAAAAVAGLLVCCGNRLPVQDTPGPGCDSTCHCAKQR